MLLVRTAGGEIRAGDRVSVGEDGLVRFDAAGKFEARGSAEKGFLVTIGPPVREPADTPSEVWRGGRRVGGKFR